MLIVGLGNQDRGDDAAGILAARRLRERGFNALEYTGATLNLLDVWSVNDRVIVVDAVIFGAAAGSIQVWDPWKVSLNSIIFRASTHEYGLADTVELARTLNRLPGWMRIYGIEGKRFDAGIEPSQEVVSGVERVTEEVEKQARANDSLYGFYTASL
jgi:hydrogenase maturation protease